MIRGEGLAPTYKAMADGYRLPIDRPDLVNIGLTPTQVGI